MAGLPGLPGLSTLPTLPSLPSLSGKSELDSSNGLYSLAVGSGLQTQADNIIKNNSGEEHKKFFQGGFISNVFDVLSADSYGVVGLMKGKGFAEGIQNRESFADDDSLGQYGLLGKIGGIALDIAVAPTTYIAPWTILGKIPGVAKGLKVAENAAFGAKTIEKIGDTGKTFETRGQAAIGLTLGDKRYEPLKMLADKVHWMFGQDPVFKEAYETNMRNVGIGIANAKKLIDDVGKVEPDVAKNFLVQDEQGRFMRNSLENLQRDLTPEQFAKVEPIYAKIDTLGQELVELGVLGQGKFEENFGTYIKNSYEEFELAKGLNKGNQAGKHGIKGSKARVEGLTKEKMVELGQIDNPAYLLFNTMLNMVKDVEDAKLFRAVADNFASDVEQVGFRKLSDSNRFRTSQGKIAELAKRVEGTNEKIKPLLKQLKSTFKADKQVMREIEGLEKELLALGTKRAEELTRFFNYGAVTTKSTQSSQKLGVIPEKLTPLANKIKQYETYDDMYRSVDGIALEKADIEGELQENGFRSMQQFFDTVKNPYRPSKTGTRNATQTEFEASFEASYGFSRKADSDITPGKPRTDADSKKPDTRAEELPLKSRINAQGVAPKVETTMKDLDLLAKKIADFNKGFKAGAKATTKQIKEVQTNAIKVIKANFDVADQAKFLTKIKNATTPAQLDELVRKLADDFADIHEKKLEQMGMSNLSNAVGLQRKIQQLTQKSELLKDIDQRSIADSFINLEKNINDLRFNKEDLLEEIAINKAGDLAGKYVPDNVANYIDELVSTKTPFGSRIVAEFKYAKVVLSPAAQVRNVLSNKILNWWKLGIGPWNLQLDAQAIKSIATKDEWYQRAQRAGLGADTFAAQELGGLLEDPQTQNLVLKYGAGSYNKIKKFMGGLYQSEEEFAKIIAFRHSIEKKGMNDLEAWKAAESATFNYSQVTPFIRNLRSNLFGVPFITFPLKAAPLVAETVLKHPQRVAFFGRMRNAIEGDSEEIRRERANEPEYIKNGFYIKLPMKDEHGRSAYFDMTYLIPFSGLMSGSLWERGTDKATGLPEGVPEHLARNFLALNTLKELFQNEDFSGNRIWRETDDFPKQMADMSSYVVKFLSPPMLADNAFGGGYDQNGEQVSNGFSKAAGASPENTRRTIYQEIGRNAGFKIQPMDAEIQESINESNKKKALRKLLQDNGVVKEFSTVYQPGQ